MSAAEGRSVMNQSSLRKIRSAFIAGIVGLLAVPTAAFAQSSSGPLVKCLAVTDPTIASGCGGVNDPLKHGVASINDMGDVSVVVIGAATNTDYTVKFVSGDGSTNVTVGNLMTGAKGDGALYKPALFKLGTVGGGNVVLFNGANVEFLTGLSISTNGAESDAD